MHVQVGRKGHTTRLQSEAVGYVVEGVAYVSGTVLIGAGLYLIMRGTFPAWWQRRFLWPLVRVTPGVAHLQGWAAVGLGISILTIVFTSVAPDGIGRNLSPADRAADHVGA